MDTLLICIIVGLLLVLVLPRILSKLGIRTYMSVVQSCVVFGSIAFMLPYIAHRCCWQNLGIFFGWEVGAIVQTILTFLHFAKQDSIPQLSHRHKTNLNILILSILFTCLFGYIFSKMVMVNNVTPLKIIPYIGSALEFIVTDAITLVPLIFYFVVNVYLFVYIKRKMHIPDKHTEAYLELLRETIRFIDMPCIIPYIMIIAFAYFYKSALDWSTFISGAGALLLLTSNLLTDTVGNKLKRIMERDIF